MKHMYNVLSLYHHVLVQFHWPRIHHNCKCVEVSQFITTRLYKKKIYNFIIWQWPVVLIFAIWQDQWFHRVQMALSKGKTGWNTIIVFNHLPLKLASFSLSFPHSSSSSFSFSSNCLFSACRDSRVWASGKDLYFVS